MLNIFTEIKKSVNLREHVEKVLGENYKNGKFSCIFHEDKSPSASIKKGSDYFLCFSCHKSGDIIDFHSHVNGTSKMEAAKDLIKMYNLEIDVNDYTSRYSPEEIAAMELRDEILNMVNEFLVNSLKESDAGYDFLEKKYGIDYESAKALSLGFVKKNMYPEFIRYLESYERNIPEEDVNKILISSGIFKENDKGDGLYQIIYDAISFPFFASNKKPETFQYRLIEPKDPKRKVMFVPEKFKYDGAEYKSDFFVSHSLYTAMHTYADRKSSKYIVPCEGPGDASAIFSRGVDSVAYCTSRISPERAEKIKKIASGREIVLWIDYDGKKTVALDAYIKYSSVEFAKLGIQHRVMMISGENKDEKFDPADCIKNMDNDIDLESFITSNSVDWIDFIIPHLKVDTMVDSFLVHLKTGFSEVVMDSFMKRIAKGTGISKSSIATDLKNKVNLEASINMYSAKFKSYEIYERLKEMEYEFFAYHDADGHEVLMMKSPKGVVHIITPGKLTSKDSPASTLSFFFDQFNINTMIQEDKAELNAFSLLAFKSAHRVEKQGNWIYNDDNTDESGELPDIYCCFGGIGKIKDIIHIRKNCTNYDDKVKIIENPDSSNSVMLDGSDHMAKAVYSRQSIAQLKSGVADMKQYIIDSVSCSESDAYMVLSWCMCSLINMQNMPTPVMWFKGGTGSGKTTAAKIFMAFVNGKSDLSIMQTAVSIYNGLATSALYGIDNLESDEADERKDIILSAATTKTRRKSNKSNNGTTITKFKANLLLTSIEPFSKSEVENRTMDIICDSKFRKDRNPDDTIRYIIKNRNEFVSTWINLFASMTSRPKFKSELNAIRKSIQKEYNFISRCDEFMPYALMLIKEFLRYELSSPAEVNVKFAQINTVFVENQRKVKRTSFEGNQTVELLETLKGKFLSRRDYSEELKHINSDNFGVEVEFTDIDGFEEPCVVITGSPTQIYNMSSRVYGDMSRRLIDNFRTSGVLCSRLKDSETLKGSGWSFDYKKSNGARKWNLKFDPRNILS